ncbi:MAG: glycolate oxidase subunit GlcE [Gammaproteobacteria bacterium]|nr:MAG: glycolate oxidase subunit GlcE [Gammaproteobacteria bacterium]
MSEMVDRDDSQQLVERVEQAREPGGRLTIIGQGSKHFMGCEPQGESLDTTDHCGVIEYEPGDLVLTARSGTPLVQIEQLLAQQGQCLGFEPPRFALNGSAAGTLGGAIASGLSGPRRPWAGAARDFVLGMTMVNGEAQRLHFGGQLIKNVAGFDLPRLIAGSMGTFGLILDISIRVLPVRPAAVTLQHVLPASEALAKMIEWQRQPLPLSGLVYGQGVLSVRLSGTAEGVLSAREIIGGDELNDAASWWDGLRDQTGAWFAEPGAVRRISCAAAAELPEIGGEWVLDWGGAQRWYRGDAPLAMLEAYARKIDGQLSCFRGADRKKPIPLADPRLVEIHGQLKSAFDPHGVFDSGRLLVQPPLAAGLQSSFLSDPAAK